METKIRVTCVVLFAVTLAVTGWAMYHKGTSGSGNTPLPPTWEQVDG